MRLIENNQIIQFLCAYFDLTHFIFDTKNILDTTVIILGQNISTL